MKNSILLKSLPLMMICIAFGSPIFASESSKIKFVENAVKKRYPETPIIEINTTPVKGIYEIVMDKGVIAYTEENGRYFFFGKLIDVQKEIVLTDLTIKKHQRIDLSKIPFSIKRVIGNGENKLWVFTDPQCPFCRNLEFEIDKLKNTTVFYVPLAFQGEKSETQVASILCATDRLKSLKDALAGKEIPKRTCKNGYDDIQDHATSRGIVATPTMFNASGDMLSGFHEVNDIEKFIIQK